MALRKTKKSVGGVDWINVLLIGTGAVLLYFLVKKVAEAIKQKRQNKEVDNVPPVATPPILPEIPDYTKVLKNGSRGVEVGILQQLLNKDGASPKLVEDRIFGAKTEAALKQIKGVSSISLAMYPITKK